MRSLLSVLIICISIQINAQELTGVIIDENGVGIENAHIIYPETLSGTSTDSLGYFSLKHIPQLKNVLVSCIGYYDSTIAIKDLNKEKIKLKKKEYLIEEIAVVANTKKEVKIGCKKKRPNGTNFITKGKNKNTSNWKGWFFYFPKKSNAKVNSIGLHIRKFDNPDVKFHIRVLAPDTTMKTFGSDLLFKQLSIPIQKGWNNFDLSNENIRFTKDGLIIVISVTGLKKNNFIDFSGNANKDYSWMSSLDYKKEFGINVYKKKKHKPAIQITILE